MQPKTSIGIALGTFLTIATGSALSASEGARDACSLLTQAQVSSVLGVSIGNGVHPGDDVPGDHPTSSAQCLWPLPGQGSLSHTRVVLQIFGPMGNLTPAQRFENAKTPVQGIEKTPVSGVGDDAYYIVSRLNISLYVKKGSSVFQVMVFGFPSEQIKTMEKTLAGDAVARL